MDGKQQRQTMDIEQNATEQIVTSDANNLPRNPYCSNEGPHCDCKCPNASFQPKWVAPNPWSLWQTFLVCLLACLIATTLVVLVLYFVHSGKATNSSSNIFIQSDGRASHVTCIFESASSTASTTQSESQGTLPSTTEANQSSSTMMTTISYPPPTRTPSIFETDKTTVEHEVEIEE